jgi:hypothetical protein
VLRAVLPLPEPLAVSAHYHEEDFDIRDRAARSSRSPDSS